MISNNYNNIDYYPISVLTVEKLAEHIGHELGASSYSDTSNGESDQAVNYALECIDCFEVLADFDINNPDEN